MVDEAECVGGAVVDISASMDMSTRVRIGEDAIALGLRE